MRSGLTAIAIAAALLAGCLASAAGASARSGSAEAGPRAAADRRAATARCAPRRIAALRTRRARAARRARCRAAMRMTAKQARPLAWPVARPIPAATISPAPATAAGSPAPSTQQPTAPVVSTVGANAYDIGGFVLRLTRSSVPAGNLTIFFHNNDVSDHDLWIEGPGGVLERISERVGEGGGASRTVAVTPGAWRMFCSLLDHEAMTRGLTVTP